MNTTEYNCQVVYRKRLFFENLQNEISFNWYQWLVLLLLYLIALHATWLMPLAWHSWYKTLEGQGQIQDIHHEDWKNPGRGYIFFLNVIESEKDCGLNYADWAAVCHILKDD